MIAVVERELYTVPEAARVLRIPDSTLRWWLEGKDGRPPVLRREPSGSTNVTWGELVEAGLLRAYRERDFSFQYMRSFVSRLRDLVGVPYPLAHARPLVGPDRHLFLKAHQEAGTEETSLVYKAMDGQVMFDSMIEQFVEQVEFALEGDERTWAIRWYPAGRKSPVVIDPEFAFGAPTVRGTRTEVIAEAVDAGDELSDVARDFGWKIEEIKSAISYEWEAVA